MLIFSTLTRMFQVSLFNQTHASRRKVNPTRPQAFESAGKRKKKEKKVMLDGRSKEWLPFAAVLR